VLDLTRVIAGPVATRTLALWGADVLRIDSPALPEPNWQHLLIGEGKRTALFDLTDSDQFRAFRNLLDGADVVITGYRGGALDRFGLGADRLVAEYPGLIVASLTAWGSTGPLAERRGFDSIVQAATGIALEVGTDGKPGALPAQALDHAAGYLLAAAITTALRRRAEHGGGAKIETSLARIAAELLEAPRADARNREFVPTVETIGSITAPLPAAAYSGGPTRWPGAAVPWGSSEPRWLD
jgi:crotonobetainyl-CoA:carnitine CoA-transferase CaiB-like acyl-CoA transferase